MKELTIFKDNETQVRTELKNNEPWFCAKDVCEILEHSNVTIALQRLDTDEVTKFNLGSKNGETNFVNEAGLYSLILGSRKPEAKQFKRWITHEVLPSIRKTGSFSTDVPKSLPEALRAYANILDMNQHLLEKVHVKDQLIGELKPKADYTDRILQNKGLVNITQIAKDYGISGAEMNKKLRELKVQYKNSRDQWLLTAKYHGRGYTHSDTIDFKHSDGRADVKMHTNWTQKGRLFLYDLLKKHDVLPVIEREQAAQLNKKTPGSATNTTGQALRRILR